MRDMDIRAVIQEEMRHYVTKADIAERNGEQAERLRTIVDSLDIHLRNLEAYFKQNVEREKGERVRTNENVEAMRIDVNNLRIVMDSLKAQINNQNTDLELVKEEQRDVNRKLFGDSAQPDYPTLSRTILDESDRTRKRFDRLEYQLSQLRDVVEANAMFINNRRGVENAVKHMMTTREGLAVTIGIILLVSFGSQAIPFFVSIFGG